MKNTTLLFLAAGFLVFTTLPVNAQTAATSQVKKETQKSQPAVAKPAATVKPAAAAAVTTPAAQTPTPVITPANPAPAAQVAPPPPPVPLTCTWDVTDYDFGKNIVHLKPASATFTMTNAGKDPVTISQVSTSCGCTAPKYTKEPIKPGEKGEVTLTYNSAVSGVFGKSAQVILNDGQKYSLTIKGEVQKVEAAPVPAATIK